MRRVLVVDDEPLVLELLTQELQATFEVVTAASYDDAIACLDSGKRIDAVVTDWRLGAGPNGLDLLHEVRERIPTAPRLMLSAHVNDFLTQVVLATGGAHACISKPWKLGRLHRQLELLLDLPSELLAPTPEATPPHSPRDTSQA